MEFLLQPGVYSTGKSKNLLNLLDQVWIQELTCGDGNIYIVSGFANYNGGVRFYPTFLNHVRSGGSIKVLVGGSTSQRLSSVQVCEALLDCGAEVYVVNRKRLLHAKCYGTSCQAGKEELVVTSGNFTGPGMSQNVEAAVKIDAQELSAMGFDWGNLFTSLFTQGWEISQLDRKDIKTKTDPAWQLLYDEVNNVVALPDDQRVSMVVTLSHSDTARIQADSGTAASKGTQYFWLSKGTFDFFPALTEKNKRGSKDTYSTKIKIKYLDLNVVEESRVTFEAGNNLDFRLGTGPYRGTKIAEERDIAVITRRTEYDYELRIIKQTDERYAAFLRYAVNFIGGQGKQFGIMPNTVVDKLV